MTPSPLPLPESTPNDTSSAEIAALNGAIVALLDNVDEYRRATFALEHRLQEYQQRIHLRMLAVEQLQTRVRQLGGSPAATRSVLASIFAGILALRPHLMRNEEKDLIEDAERGEASVLCYLRGVLAKLHFSDSTRTLLREAMEWITKRPTAVTPHRSLAEVVEARTPAMNSEQFETVALTST